MTLNQRLDQIAVELYYEANEDIAEALELLRSARRFNRYRFSSEVWPKIAAAMMQYHSFCTDPLN